MSDRIYSVFRRAVKPSIDAFRASAFLGVDEVLCPVTGLWVKTAEAHVDHEPPWTFLAILREYLRQTGRELIDVKIKSTGTYPVFEDPAEHFRWVTFHDAAAHLRVVHWRANLSEIKKMKTDVVPTWPEVKNWTVKESDLSVGDARAPWNQTRDPFAAFEE